MQENSSAPKPAARDERAAGLQPKGGDNQVAAADRPPNLSLDVELALRDEIRTTQGAQSDLMKWKLIAVAAVGALSIRQNTELRYQLLCLVPLICLYTDLICLHYMLRIITIGAFIRASYRQILIDSVVRPGEPLLDYEGFVFKTRQNKDQNPFNLEVWAIVGSSFMIDGALLVISLLLLGGVIGQQPLNDLTLSVYILFSLGGILCTNVMRSEYRKRVCKISNQGIYRQDDQDICAGKSAAKE